MNPLLLSAALLTPLLSPPNFQFSAHEKAVFVDFKNANYAMIGEGHALQVVSEIELEQSEAGHILFDLEVDPSEVILDGRSASAPEIKTPDHETKLRVLSLQSEAGIHHLKIVSKVRDESLFKAETYFKMRDLYDRHFLEQYLPTNLEYDQYAMTIDLSLPSSLNFKVMSNATSDGYVPRQNGRDQWHFVFPESFNCSSIFFHIFRKGTYEISFQNFTTQSGRVIPIYIYGPGSEKLWQYGEKADATLHELERDYGEYPHPSLVIFAKGSGGGMEYTGATESSLVSLDHEIFHQYFGRGVMPANGNAGALDEALASWRDYGYFQTQKPDFSSGQIAGHSVYARNTDKHSYVQGRQFFAYIDFKLNGQLKAFMKEFYQSHVHQVVTMESFKDELNRFSNTDFSADFQQYLF